MREDIAVLGADDAIKVAGIVSFYRAVSCANRVQMESIERIFGVYPADFWAIVNQLHDLEVLDVYEGEIVKFSEQVISTYLFYLAVFELKLIPFSTLLDEFFPGYKEHFIDALNPVLNALGARVEEHLRVPVVEKWEKLRALGDHKALERRADSDVLVCRPRKNLA
jgi:hypothetical protein